MRIAEVRAQIFVAALLICVPAAAQSGLTGNWSGTYSFTTGPVAGCSNKTFTTSGNVTVTFFQIDSSLAGRMDLTNLLDFNGGCNPTKVEFTSVISGSTDGTSVAWTFPNDSNGTAFNGTAAGGTITASISDASGDSGTVTLTRTPADAATADATGSWSGTYNFTDVCPNGSTKKSYSGGMTLALTQANGRASGVALMQSVPLYDQNCTNLATLDMVMEVAGTVSGSTFNGGVYDPSGSFEFPITATIANGAISGSPSGANETSTTGTFNLTQSSSQPGVSDFTGAYDLSYDEVDDETSLCFNIAALAYSGTGVVRVVQAGDLVTGSITMEGTESITSDGFGDCFVVDAGEEVLPLYGTLASNQLSTTLPVFGTAAQYTMTFAPNTISGTISDDFGDLLTIDAARTPPSAPSSRRRAVVP